MLSTSFPKTNNVPQTRCDADATDTQLMRLICQRNPDALQILFQRYSGRGIAVALRLGIEYDIAQDIVADAFLRIWNQGDSYRARKGSFTSWFSAIVHNLAVDELRRMRTRTNAQVNAFRASQIGAGPNDPESVLVQNLDAMQVRDALAQLPDYQRDVLRLAYFEGMTRREISKELSLPVGTIHTRVRLGKQKLKSLLRERKPAHTGNA